MGIAIHSTIESVQTRKDKTLKITIGSQELDGKQMAELMSLNQTLAICYISEKSISNEEKQAIDNVTVEAPKDFGKSPSQRMRNVMYKVWETTPTGVDNFDNYYDQQMERVIEHYKEKIE